MKTINELYADMTEDDFNMLRGVLKEMRQRGLNFEERLVDTHDPYVWLAPPLETAAPPVRVYSIAGVITWRAQPEVDGHPEGPANSFDVSARAAEILERAAEEAEDGTRKEMPTQDAAIEQAIADSMDAINDWAARYGWRRPQKLNIPTENGKGKMNVKEAVDGILYSATCKNGTVRGFTADRREVTVETAEDGGAIVSCEGKRSAVLPEDIGAASLRSAILSVVE